MPKFRPIKQVIGIRGAKFYPTRDEGGKTIPADIIELTDEEAAGWGVRGEVETDSNGTEKVDTYLERVSEESKTTKRVPAKPVKKGGVKKTSK